MCSVDARGGPQESEVLDFVSQVTDAARQRIEENLPHGFVRLKVAEAERRQAQHDIRSVEDVVTELVRNSRDAGARRVLVAFQKEQGRYRRLAVADDGRGVPSDMHEVVFEPRVTSKSRDFEEDRYGVHGRGMALFSIRSRAMSAKMVFSEPEVGTVIHVSIDTRKVPERSDQATLPRIEESESGCEVGSGPHNVARVLLEMSVDHPDMEFYMGSFSEVLATARVMALEEGHERTPWHCLAGVDDARVLVEESQRLLGGAISERNAYRILNDEIANLDPILSQARMVSTAPRSSVGQARASARRGVRMRSPLRKLSKDDLSEIGEGCAKVIEGVVSRYYLHNLGAPRVRRSRGKLIVSFYVSDDEGGPD